VLHYKTGRTNSIEYAGPPDDLQEHSIQDAKLGGAATGGGDSTHGLWFPLIAKHLACMVASSATAEHVLDVLTHMNLSQGIIPDEVCLSPPPSLLPKRKTIIDMGTLLALGLLLVVAVSHGCVG
jgi:hypothetical protein